MVLVAFFQAGTCSNPAGPGKSPAFTKQSLLADPGPWPPPWVFRAHPPVIGYDAPHICKPGRTARSLFNL